MNFQEQLFTHSVARFRSSLPLSTLQLWTSRHSYDLVLALNQAACRILGHPVAFITLSLNSSAPMTEIFLAIEIDKAPFDLFGTNVITRIEEATFEEDINVDQTHFDSEEKLLNLLANQDFFLNYWPPEVNFSALVLDGILSASEELS